MQLPLFTENTLQLETDRREFLQHIQAAQTQKGYRYDWLMFQAWCREMRRADLPASPDTVSLYLTDLLHRGRKVATARRRYHAIAYRHRSQGISYFGQVEALNLLRGAQRLRSEKPRQMRPLTISELREISETLARDGTVKAIRNRAVILTGFASALRSASLAALTLDDVEFTEKGLILTIPREKQDQEGRGRFIGIPYGKSEKTCAVQALRKWLDLRPEVSTRRVFLGFASSHRWAPMEAENVCRIVKQSIIRIGLDPKNYGSHSLRAGFITEAGEAGISDLMIADHSGHTNLQVLKRYLRRKKVFKANVCAALDL